MTAPTLTAPTDTGVCGTPAGRQRHRRNGEDPCDPCLNARRGQQRGHYAVRTARRRNRPLVTAEDRAAAAKAPRLTSGILAGRQTSHDFAPMPVKTGVGTLCAACWGWRDDPRHPVLGGPVVGR
ncbi:hypothetical protein ACWER9_06630 [Micromonospora sp. NPDC003944]